MAGAQQRGLDYEHELARDVYEATDGRIFPIRAGFSGNSAIPLPDLVVDDGSKVHAIELKTTKDDRDSVTFDPEGIGDPSPGDDLSELLTFAQNQPRTVCPYVGMKFTRRQLVLAKLWIEAPDHHSMLESASKSAPTDVRVTHSDNLSFHRPDTDEWPSARSGDDAAYLLETIGYTDP